MLITAMSSLMYCIKYCSLLKQTFYETQYALCNNKHFKHQDVTLLSSCTPEVWVGSCQLLS